MKNSILESLKKNSLPETPPPSYDSMHVIVQSSPPSPDYRRRSSSLSRKNSPILSETKKTFSIMRSKSLSEFPSNYKH